ncbi:MAG TPA: hypothetical protein VMU94_02880 [Streptosporangiaceae bacterium]|nr:hypothetical protein [Streptosporangiaceae bacterium]
MTTSSRLTAAEQAVHQAREMLAGVRSEVALPDGPKVPPGP